MAAENLRSGVRVVNRQDELIRDVMKMTCIQYCANQILPSNLAYGAQ